MRSALVALLALVATGCPRSGPPTPTSTAAPPVAPDLDVEPAADDGGVDDEPAVAEAGCSTNDDCPADHVCEGEGCEPGAGTCAPKSRMCTRDLQPYCGCDGVTFRNSGSCPGARFSARGPCEGDAGPGGI